MANDGARAHLSIILCNDNIMLSMLFLHDFDIDNLQFIYYILVMLTITFITEGAFQEAIQSH